MTAHVLEFERLRAEEAAAEQALLGTKAKLRKFLSGRPSFRTLREAEYAAQRLAHLAVTDKTNPMFGSDKLETIVVVGNLPFQITVHMTFAENEGRVMPFVLSCKSEQA